MTVSIQYRLSGGASNSDPLASIGGAMSSNQLGSDFWDAVTDQERVSGDTEYRQFYIVNDGSSTAFDVKLWINVDATNGDHAIGLDPGGVNTTTTPVANENTAPAGVTFSDAATEGAALSLGNLAAGQRYPIWERRTIASGATAGLQSRTLRVSFEA